MLFDVLLAIHVAGGFVALLSGPVAMASRKGGRTHRRYGGAYAIAMVAAGVAALPLSLMTHNVLLLVIAVLTLYLVGSGIAAIRRRRAKRASRLSDALLPACCVVFSAGLLLFSLPIMGRPSFVTGLFFGAGGMFLAGRSLLVLRDPAADWLQQHITGMMGAYIATATAFLVVNLTFLPQAVVFIGPTLVGVPFIVWMSMRHARPKAQTAALAG